MSTWAPPLARSAASRWCDQSEVTPVPARAAYTDGSTQAGQSASCAARAGTSWTWRSRGARSPAARRARAASGSKPGRVADAVRAGMDIAATVIPRADGVAGRPREMTSRERVTVDLSVSSSEQGAVTIVHVAGEIDVYTAPLLREVLDKQVAAGRTNLVVVLENVTFMDSTGLGVLVGRLKLVRGQNGSLRIVSAQDRILKVFKITGLDKVFHIFPSVEEATSASTP